MLTCYPAQTYPMAVDDRQHQCTRLYRFGCVSKLEKIEQKLAVKRMNHNINKSSLAVPIAMALLFGPWHSNGGTNGASKQTITGAGNAAIKRPNWAGVEGQFEGAKDTNGWSCMLQISNQSWLSDQCPPARSE